MNEQLKRLGEELLASVKGYVKRSLEAFDSRLKAVEARPPATKGDTGEKGEPGRDGQDGQDGQDGKDGPPGADGLKGDKGDPGERGEKGADGIDGKDVDLGAWAVMVKEVVGSLPAGAPIELPPPLDQKAVAKQVLDEVLRNLESVPLPKDGAPGQQGEKGDKGDPGEPGVPGEKGADGIDGKDGAPGADGQKGDPGPQGEKGADGIDGKDGANGLDGKDADPALVRSEVERAVAALPAAPTPDEIKTLVVAAVAALPPAPAGQDGAPGKDGRDGIDGKSIDLAEVQAEIARLVALLPKAVDGLAGKDGQDGQDGRDGRDGDHGRDATAINILDGLDPAKKYQRGTHATFRGGMVCSFRATDPLGSADDPEGHHADLEKCGWQVTLNGEQDFDFELGADQRTLKVHRVDTRGRVIDKQFRVPTLIYRGVWKEGEAYTQGDSATRDGGTWVLMSAAAHGRPGEEGSGWQLAVKKGTPGRDGLKGEKGERGAQGRDGQDRPAPMVAP